MAEGPAKPVCNGQIDLESFSVCIHGHVAPGTHCMALTPLLLATLWPTRMQVSLVVVSGREVCVREASEDSGVMHELQALLLPANSPELDLNSDSICLNWINSECDGVR